MTQREIININKHGKEKNKIFTERKNKDNFESAFIRSPINDIISLQKTIGNQTVQNSFINNTEQVIRSAIKGTKGSGSKLPHMEKIQESFGRFDISNIRAFIGGFAKEAAQKIHATAYTTGDAIAFTQTPSLYIAAHEAAHVVQQRNNVKLKDGVGKSNDVFERNANAVADMVLRGRSAENLLSQFGSKEVTNNRNNNVEPRVQKLTPEQETQMDEFARQHNISRDRVIWTPIGPQIRLGQAYQARTIPEMSLSDEEVIRLIDRDPIWRQAFDQATIQFTIQNAGRFASTPSFSVIGDTQSLMQNLGTDRATAEQIRSSLLMSTREWHHEYMRQLRSHQQ